MSTPSLHPVDLLVHMETTAAQLRAVIAADREARVGSTHHAIVERVDDRDHVIVEPLPDLREVYRLLQGHMVVIDTETTGLHRHNGDRLITFAAIGVDLFGHVADAEPAIGRSLHLIVNPRRPSSPQALAVHKLTETFLNRYAPFGEETAEMIVDRLKGRVVVAHNAPFDLGFLASEFDEIGLTFEGVPLAVIDTRIVAKMLWPGETATLDALATRLGIDRGDRDAGHDAVDDAILLARCLPGILAELKRRYA